MSDQERCPRCGNVDKLDHDYFDVHGEPGRCFHPWHDSAPSSVAEQPSREQATEDEPFSNLRRDLESNLNDYYQKGYQDGLRSLTGETTSSGSHRDAGANPEVAPALPDSPSAAGSGAREWFNVNMVEYDQSKNYYKLKDGRVFRSRDDLLQAYADHCTAQLREQIKNDPGNQLFGMPLLEVLRIINEHTELTAERTRREAAERELKRVQEALRMHHAVASTNCMICERAALRGKEGE